MGCVCVGGYISQRFIFKQWYLYRAIFYIPVVPARPAASPRLKSVSAPPAAVSGVRGHGNDGKSCTAALTRDPPENWTSTKLRLRRAADIKGQIWSNQTGN